MGTTITASFQARAQGLALGATVTNTVLATAAGCSRHGHSESAGRPGGAGLTTVYVGQHFEKFYPTTSSYYYLDGQRVAMKKAGTLSYLLTDHLGSTSVVTNQSGGIVAQQL